MLLYAKVATPKVPKKRSRSAELYIVELIDERVWMHTMKKKCNEERPACQRCAEKDLECIYESVKPRQRKRHTSREPLSPLSPIALQRRPQALDLGFQDLDNNFSFWADEVATPVAETPTHASHGEAASDGTFPSTRQLLSRHQEAPYPSLDLPLFSPDASAVFELSPYSGGGGGEGEDEEIPAHTPTTTELVPLSPHYSRRESFLGSSQHANHFFQFSMPLDSFINPLYSEFSQEHRHRTLIDHFNNVLARLIVLNEESGNPFQRLILPMCQSSDAVRNAVFALSSAHREYRGLIGPCVTTLDAENSTFFYNQAIQGIAKLIEAGTSRNKNELLAAIMLIVYYEVLVKDGQTNIVDGHLKGAMLVLNASEESLDTTGAFLERAFRFYEVIAALSFGTAPLSYDVTAAFGATRKDGLNSGVDTLLGMASTLWPILHKLSTLLSLKQALEAMPQSEAGSTKLSSLRAEFETRAYSVDVALKRWKPNLPQQFFTMSEGEQGGPATEQLGTCSAGSSGETTTASDRAHLHSVLNNALAYQHSAIVYLHRTIYGHSRSHALVQRHAHVSLTHCVAAVRNGGPMGALLWPLFVAACEAVTLGDRDLATQAFLAVERRQGMVNIERSWAVVQEVWRRADAAEELSSPSMAWWATGRDLWRKISEEMGVTLVLG
ncbi:unnamed protein product [Parascedosporium putredinis]|uniref:Zn(2)-C6 fungal-type domain-containing protein n=1 Tax=Parascedosporium putredinis TaxID=1442378 RepID=A0A9P1H7E1_9PEZI|nr:unnamed protein product [Parascedosporium putredinis]CAI7999762.1 unnamed protein product [Parascedosporium putredinis]